MNSVNVEHKKGCQKVLFKFMQVLIYFSLSLHPMLIVQKGQKNSVAHLMCNICVNVWFYWRMPVASINSSLRFSIVEWSWHIRAIEHICFPAVSHDTQSVYNQPLQRQKQKCIFSQWKYFTLWYRWAQYSTRKHVTALTFP